MMTGGECHGTTQKRRTQTETGLRKAVLESEKVVVAQGSSQSRRGRGIHWPQKVRRQENVADERRRPQAQGGGATTQAALTDARQTGQELEKVSRAATARVLQDVGRQDHQREFAQTPPTPLILCARFAPLRHGRVMVDDDKVIRIPQSRAFTIDSGCSWLGIGSERPDMRLYDHQLPDEHQ